MMPDTHNHTSAERLPPAPLLHVAALLSGWGTAFLGPSLPTLTQTLHLSDRGAGALLLAQFTGAFLGGWTTRSPLHRCLLRGYGAALAGFATLAATLLAHAGLPWAMAALVLLGFGIGQIITSNNLLASLLWPQHRGSALLLLNFTWSAGALCAPLLLPRLLQALPASTVFYTVVALLLLAAGLTQWVPGRPATALSSADTPESGTDKTRTSTPAERGMPTRSYLYFCVLLFLYGGVETSLSGWLTTYDARYGAATHAIAASTAAFWFCLTGTRAVASALLLRLPERRFLRGGLLLAVLTLAALLAAGRGSGIPLLAGLAGVALAPWFPLVFSSLVTEGPTATQAGRVVAVSGLGAAALPWLVGLLSTGAGSLRLGLLLPIGATAGLFLLSLRRPPDPARLRN